MNILKFSPRLGTHYQNPQSRAPSRTLSQVFPSLAHHTRHLDFVPLKWHDFVRHIAGHCGNKVSVSVRLALETTVNKGSLGQSYRKRVNKTTSTMQKHYFVKININYRPADRRLNFFTCSLPAFNFLPGD